MYKDGLNPVYEEAWDSATSTWVQTRFVYASRANVPDFVIRDNATYRMIADHLGSPRLVINTTNGLVEQALEYDEWGNVLSDTYTGAIPLHPFAFAGGLYDADTKLVRFGARDYDPEIGRWIAKDPIGFGGGDTNLFGYTFNDPINLIDILGLYSKTVLSGNKLIIIVPIKYSRQELNITQAELEDYHRRLQKAVSDAWNKRIGGLEVIVTTCPVDWNTNTNHVRLTRQLIGSHVIGDSGLFSLYDDNNTIAHEVGHLMGHGDKYNDVTGLPISSDWQGNIMAEHGGRVDANNIKEIVPSHLKDRVIQLIEQ